MDDLKSRPEGRQVLCFAAICGLLLLTFLVRALHPGQPIVENYVGRQVPTAMVARNLERGSGPLRPQLETAPFPNYFVVEPPIYESCVVALRRLTPLALPEAGRVVSALFSALAAWGLFMLAKRREGAGVALLAVLVFSVFPLSIRYGRAFQPDAAMLGAAVAGLACWDRSLAPRSASWRAAGWCLLAVGLAIKITSAFLLIPLLWMIVREGRRWEIAAACATLLPASLWYLWADHLIGQGTGSKASLDNRSIWLALLGPSALLDPATIKVVGWAVLVRAFTPLGAALALFGLWKQRQNGESSVGFWWVWGARRALARWRFWPASCTMSITGCRWRPWRQSGRREPSTGSPVMAVRSPRVWRPRSSFYASSRRAPPGELRPSGRASRPQAGPSGRSSPTRPGWRLPRLSCSRQIAADAAWNGPPTRPAGPPESGGAHRPSKAPSSSSITTGKGAPATSPIWAVATLSRRERACTTQSADDTR